VQAGAPERLAVPPHLRVKPGAAREQARAAQEATGTRPRWQVRREQRRQQRARSAPPDDEQPEAGPFAAATVGTYVGLCLLVRFPDVPDTITQQEISNYCNQAGYSGFGNNGSVHDYFLAVSEGRLTYTNHVTAYYTAQNNRSYYTDPAVAYGTRAQELIVEALDDLRNQGFNFDQLTADSGGYVRALNVFYAGPVVNNWSEGLWPHSWALASTYVASPTRRFSDYQITDIGSQLTLRTFCHENGHMICDFPDLYDYGGESNGVGHFCLMCFGGSDTNPVHPCAYLKNFAGWTTTLRQIAPGMNYTVAAGRNDFLIHRRNQMEYFILENRARTGRDAALPDAGLAIWHVDENGSNSNEQMSASQHYECSLEQADGQFHLEHAGNAGDAQDLFGAPSAPVFDPSTNPSSAWWDGSASGLTITAISAPGASMIVSTQVQWQNDRVVLRTHAKNMALQSWAFFQGDTAWLQIGGSSLDGNRNVFNILTEALANNRKVDILVSQGRIVEATLK
jgi:M6 family metalloprotease-like protein